MQIGMKKKNWDHTLPPSVRCQSMNLHQEVHKLFMENQGVTSEKLTCIVYKPGKHTLHNVNVPGCNTLRMI